MPDLKCDHLITVHYKAKQFSYTDEDGREASVKKHCRPKETIGWTLDGSPSEVLTIKFNYDEGNPFGLPNETIFNAGCCYKIQGNPSSLSYRYTAYISKSGKEIDHNDPQMMLDVDLQGGLGTLGGPSADQLAIAAEQAWEKIFDRLSGVKNEGASGIQFYPHGINDIEVTVGFAGVTVNVKVSGPSS